MSTIALNNLWTFIESMGLSYKNRKWLADKLIEPSKADELNAITIKAINEVRAGKTFKAASVDDLLKQCLAGAMYDLEYSGQFKRDLKLMAKRGLDIEDMRKALGYLAKDGQVPESYQPHILKGKYAGIWECHINPDWLLMYDITDSIKLVRLVRTGTHSDLFKK